MDRVGVVVYTIVAALGLIAIGWIIVDNLDRETPIPHEEDTWHTKKVYFEITNTSDKGYWYVISSDNKGKDYRFVYAGSTTKYDTACQWYGKSTTTTTLYIDKHEGPWEEHYYYKENFTVDDRVYHPTYRIEF